MSCFAARCGRHDAAADAALLDTLRREGVQRVRIAWCDLHGVLRGKTLTLPALASALARGVTMVSTVALKDTSDRTAFKVFEPGTLAALPGFGPANNLILLPDPASLQRLPWAPDTAWLRADAFFEDATPVPIDPRRVLQRALARLRERGLEMVCGLEVEFHVYRIEDPRLDPAEAAWPGEPPRVSLIHPGYNLLAEGWGDQCDEVLAIVQRTCEGLGLPLASLEIELGPSQVEAVFDAADALTAADRMVLFRNGVRQALRRAGYHASFVCRPPFANVMASGWHLHHSLVHADGGANAFMPAAPAPGSDTEDAAHWLSGTGCAWLAGLLAHARGGSAFCTTTVNGYGRFRPNALAPVSVIWGRDNRGAMLRVLGGAGDGGTRVENRAGEPMANPYLYFAAQVHAGLDGLARQLVPPPASLAPYAEASVAARLPTSLAEALDALVADEAMCAGMGAPLVHAYTAIKRMEQQRHDQADDKEAWMRREYFSRF